MPFVEETTCEARRESLTSVEKKVDNAISIQNKHADKIVDLEIVMERVVTLIENVIKSMDKTEEQKLEIEKIKAAKPKFWETKNGTLLLKALIVVGIAIIVVAIGININALDCIK